MIYFIGAGPGDVDLISVKGRQLLQNAEIVIYAGSLVNPEHLKFCKTDTQIFDSAGMTLEEIIAVMQNNSSKEIVRLHTGDPALYGSIFEQMNELDRLRLEYQIVPGISSFTASCAALKKEMTLPGISQTVILSRIAGRTPVPESQKLSNLAVHKASMALFLSVQDIDNVVAELIPSYGEDCPAAVVYKASWADEKIVRATLATLPNAVKEAKIGRQAQILVGDFLESTGEKSKLYAADFKHGYRK